MERPALVTEMPDEEMTQPNTIASAKPDPGRPNMDSGWSCNQVEPQYGIESQSQSSPLTAVAPPSW